jgi:hypothetical protein
MLVQSRSDRGCQGLSPNQLQLIERARSCVDQGFAPPAEIYRVEHRRVVDWATFPSWARPQDPDAFDGCCHEG